jgi:hypothetical protein
MEIDEFEPTETDMLKNKDGLPEVKHVHYDNSIKSKIHGFILYFCKRDEIAKCCEPVFFIVFAFFVIMLVVFTFIIIGWIYNTCFPHNKFYNHEEVKFFVNSTKYDINPQYDSCYVENNVKHCHLYEENSLFIVGLTVFFTYLLALIATFVGSMTVFEKGYYKMAVFCAISSALIMGAFIYFVNTQLFDEIQFYGKTPPHAFKNTVFDCEKLSAIEIECKHHDANRLINCLLPFSMFGMPMISVSIAGTCIILCEKWAGYMEFRESVKKSVQAETVNLV